MAVLYGSAAGLTATGSQYLTRNTAGGAGSAALDDRFARSMAAANFGRSSVTDLAISSGSEGVGGAVHVLYGSDGRADRGGQPDLEPGERGDQGDAGGGRHLRSGLDRGELQWQWTR